MSTIVNVQGPVLGHCRSVEEWTLVCVSACKLRQGACKFVLGLDRES